MNVIYKIAKNEFRYLFYSPIAWFLLIVFLVQCAIYYTGFVYDSANWQDILLKNNPKLLAAADRGAEDSLTATIFLKAGIFANVIQNLYLFIPLLTMGLIGREVSAGTIKLLYSSPIKLRQLVLGKYLGIMLFNLLLLLIVSIFIVTGILNIRLVDYGPLLSAALAFYLLVCAYSAIGLFMSSLSTYQVVSAFSTFTAIFLLGRIDGLWQKYDIIRDLTYFLSLQNRTMKMVSGLITTKDVIYFIAVAIMFTGLTLVKLKNGRQSKPWYIKAGRYVLVVASVLFIGFISSRPIFTGYWDTTARKTLTIHPNTQKLIKEMGDNELEVTLYTNLFQYSAVRGLPQSRNADYLSNFWEPYLRFKPDVVFKYEYYYDTDAGSTDSALFKSFPGKTLNQIAQTSAEALDADLSWFKAPEEMRKTIDLLPENYNIVMRLKYKGRTEFLRTFGDALFWPDEAIMDAALKRLLSDKIQKVAFITGGLERNIDKTGEREYGSHTALKGSRVALVNQGFDLDTVNLSIREIPADADILVLADPKIALGPIELGKLRNYLNKGGNMIVAGEPGKQEVINPLLSQLGVQLMNGQLVQLSFDETPDKVTPYLTEHGYHLSEMLGFMKKQFSPEDSINVLMPGATGIAYKQDSPFTITPLLTTVPGSGWLKAEPLVSDSAPPIFSPQEGDLRINSVPTGVALTRRINNKEQRIIVFGDADFMSNVRLPTCVPFCLSMYSWLDENQFPIFISRPRAKDVLLKIHGEGAYLQKIVYRWVLPALLLLAGIILPIRRKRK